MIHLLVLALLQDDPAETLKKLEERLVRAKTFQVAYRAEATIRFGPEKRVTKAEATLKVKGPAKFRVDEKLDEHTVTIASDGEWVVSKSGGAKEQRRPMKNSAERFAILYARMGLMTSAWISMVNEDKDPSADDEEYLPDLRKLASYSGTVSAGEKAIRYTVTYRKRGEEADSTATVTVWLDANGLPSQRKTEHTSGVRMVVAEETYSDWKIDEDIDDAVFKP